ncbi:protein strawberry notch isoform X1 [Dendroctonus ponderosae]|uniref:protein strawberry notch isoform X1 n=2 Tax=Dendroctonus ponderosae TaxID=77166 RepID=UPI002035D8E5|nr:protein strawberry notch isoform X1 [Dendroctonus ponderosae]
MPRAKKVSKKAMDDEDLSGSDFDDDEDPDKIEVPGGGKDLATAAAIGENRDIKLKQEKDLKPDIKLRQMGAMGMNSKMMGGIPGMNLHPSAYDMMRQPMGPPFGAPTNSAHMGNLAAMASMLSSITGGPMANMFGVGHQGGPGGSGGASASAAAFNAAQFLQQMEMAAFGMGGNPYGNPILQNLSAMLYNTNPMAPWGGQLSNKAVQQMWMNPMDSKSMPQHQDEEEVDDEELGVAETYADYMPSKLKLGKKHPDPVVETASLSSVAPVDVWYTVSIPEETIKTGALSALQLESITYTSQAHENILPGGSRAGFLIGDGAGVGKGRTIAGIIYENYLKGRKRAIWVSVSNDLKYDAERDLRDIGAGKIEVHPLNKFKYAKISSAVNNNVKRGVIFSTYSALIGESNSAGGKYKSRLKQLLQWCGQDFDGLIIFDECHRAKNLCPVGSSKPTKTGLTVLEVQNKLPKARVVYASATGASEPRNMAYMVRLGLWGEGTPFNEFADFISAVEKRGVGAMEIVAMDMKLRGMYIARQLSFHGVAFKIEEVPLSRDFEKVYDASVKLWVEAMQKFNEAAELVDAENRMRKTMWGQFWSAHQRFFKYLCIAAKVPHAVAVAHEAIKMGKCVVIGLQSTGEARTLEQLERDDGELTDFVSTAKGVFQTLVEKHFPAPDRTRIHKLLGIGAGSELAKKLSNGNSDEGSSSQKRKPVRQAAQRAVKRNKWSTSDTDNSEKSDSDFQMSDNESEISDGHSDSNQSSDFNPFNSDSDSDNDPWSRNKKKGKKQKKAPKKRQSTQDKLSVLLTQKTTKAKANGGSDINSSAPPMDAIERACSMKEELLRAIERLGEKLPPNTLDQLIDELGGPENVAEMTGRKGRVVQTEDGGIQYESRSEIDVPLETLNLTEKQRFMDGEKDVAIISEAASSGISLQSDRRVKNQRRRVHITLELPWSADRAIQQFGRTHRSNQVNAPEYIFLISDLAGERRFASIVAKRLESLGALTHGDRRATETRDLSQFNIDNKYGRAALEATMKAIMGYEKPVVLPPEDYKGEFFKDVAGALVGVGLIVNSENMPGVLSLDKDYNNMSKFLNRILGMPVELQNRLFKYFTDTLAAIITQAKRSGRFDLGILDLGAGGEVVKRARLVTFLRKHATGTAPTELHTVHVERGMAWPEALDKFSELTSESEGFWLSHQARNAKHTAILAIAVEGGNTNSNKKKSESKKEQMFSVYRPNTGLQFRQESLAELEKKYKKVDSADAEKSWTEQYDSSVNTCSHAFWRGNCRNATAGHECEVGLRRRTYHVVSGSVLSVWSRVEAVLAARGGVQNKMQVIRLRTEEDLKVVGTVIPKNCVDALIEALSSDAEKVEEKAF